MEKKNFNQLMNSLQQKDTQTVPLTLSQSSNEAGTRYLQLLAQNPILADAIRQLFPWNSGYLLTSTNQPRKSVVRAAESLNAMAEASKIHARLRVLEYRVTSVSALMEKESALVVALPLGTPLNEIPERIIECFKAACAVLPDGGWVSRFKAGTTKNGRGFNRIMVVGEAAARAFHGLAIPMKLGGATKTARLLLDWDSFTKLTKNYTLFKLTGFPITDDLVGDATSVVTQMLLGPYQGKEVRTIVYYNTESQHPDEVIVAIFVPEATPSEVEKNLLLVLKELGPQYKEVIGNLKATPMAASRGSARQASVTRAEITRAGDSDSDSDSEVEKIRPTLDQALSLRDNPRMPRTETTKRVTAPHPKEVEAVKNAQKAKESDEYVSILEVQLSEKDAQLNEKDERIEILVARVRELENKAKPLTAATLQPPGSPMKRARQQEEVDDLAEYEEEIESGKIDETSENQKADN